MVYPCVHVNKFHIKQNIFLPFAYFNIHFEAMHGRITFMKHSSFFIEFVVITDFV